MAATPLPLPPPLVEVVVVPRLLVVPLYGEVGKAGNNRGESRGEVEHIPEDPPPPAAALGYRAPPLPPGCPLGPALVGEGGTIRKLALIALGPATPPPSSFPSTTNPDGIACRLTSIDPALARDDDIDTLGRRRGVGEAYRLGLVHPPPPPATLGLVLVELVTDSEGSAAENEAPRARAGPRGAGEEGQGEERLDVTVDPPPPPPLPITRGEGGGGGVEPNRCNGVWVEGPGDGDEGGYAIRGEFRTPPPLDVPAAMAAALVPLVNVGQGRIVGEHSCRGLGVKVAAVPVEGEFEDVD